MDAKKIILDGQNLTIEDVYRLTRETSVRVDIAERAKKKVHRSKDFLDQSGRSKKIVYGFNTGFGPMASYLIGLDQAATLQRNLIYSHAVGMGQPLEESQVLAAMVVRLNTLARGYSGVSFGLLQLLSDFINHRLIPIVPEHGAVGTSGDLVQLAHIALALIGEGEVFYRGQRQPVKGCLRRLGLKPHLLQSREGLALINGTAMMSGIASLLVSETEQLLGLAVRLGAWSLELVKGFDDGLAERLHNFRPHRGQKTIAKSMRSLLASSRRLQDRSEWQKALKTKTGGSHIEEEVQQVYSLRCIPQILGPVLDVWYKVKREVEIEINAVTDNPIIDPEKNNIWHGGNFHGDYIASAMDQLKMAIVKLTMLSERRTDFFLNSKINQRFPPFMNLNQPGLTLGLQGLQFVATSTTAQSQSYAYPHHLHSIPTNGDNQDVVSMGTDAALMTSKVIANAFVVATIEALTLAQGTEWDGKISQFSQSARNLFKKISRIIFWLEDHRPVASNLEKLGDQIRKKWDLKVPELNGAE